MLSGVERLGGSDSGFLFIETHEQTSVCVDLLELAPESADAPLLTREDVAARVRDRMHLLPSWGWRLQHVPLRIHHPVWVEDPDFVVEDHIRHRVLPAPGGAAELNALMAELEPLLLDLRHPLWQIVLVDGLGGPGSTRQALVLRIHHTVADGAAILHTFDLLFGDAAGELPRTEARPVPPLPTRRTLLRQAAREQVHNWRQLPRMLKDTKAIFETVEARREEAVAVVPRPMGDAPNTILNQPGPAVRTYARTILPISDLQRVRATTGATLNDVALAMVAGSLRSYLLARGALPERGLVANVPVSGDPPGTPPRQWGNRFANFFALLHTDVEDPRERLTAISASTAEAKLQLQLQGHDTLTEWLDRMPPLIGRPAARAMVNKSARNTEQADFNALVSNVRITARDWRIGAQRVSHVYLSGPIGDDTGLNVTVVGYEDELHVTVVGNPVTMSDPDEVVDGMRAALEELIACTV
ncbi:wax ester/triacylglycerol synthase family O-acyltransferase [Aquihabitans daechungensis]|uniref:wax ester/triacylglycerol synthase family O-acyltransferase n=1 Tax=Aquihabitans daechungensis TaxID=1052257 RepID=UPI003BA237DC